jgi:hypothetical protein
MSDYWYENRSRLNCGDVCELEDGSIVRLYDRVPGDGTDWLVDEYYNGGWFREMRRIHPSDIKKGPQW